MHAFCRMHTLVFLCENFTRVDSSDATRKLIDIVYLFNEFISLFSTRHFKLIFE
jgi:hypothetical protein